MSCCPEWKGAGSCSQGHKGMDTDMTWPKIQMRTMYGCVTFILCAPPFPCLGTFHPPDRQQKDTTTPSVWPPDGEMPLP